MDPLRPDDASERTLLRYWQRNGSTGRIDRAIEVGDEVISVAWDAFSRSRRANEKLCRFEFGKRELQLTERVSVIAVGNAECSTRGVDDQCDEGVVATALIKRIESDGPLKAEQVGDRWVIDWSDGTSGAVYNTSVYIRHSYRFEFDLGLTRAICTRSECTDTSD